ncbi:hypothetical protein U3A55_04980 [Salarchaeum sp. III]|uniref:hypothetical protein n=1 Tax=Salarchaeum sp. III TaxID=3107927 RepID=UPI002EDAFA38
MTQQNWNWEDIETIGRGLPDYNEQLVQDPAMLDDPMIEDTAYYDDPLLDDY